MTQLVEELNALLHHSISS